MPAAEPTAGRLATLRGPAPGRVARWALTIAVVAALYAVAPLYDGTFFLSFLVDVLILGLAALGLQHIVGDAGVLNLGQAALIALAAMVLANASVPTAAFGRSSTGAGRRCRRSGRRSSSRSQAPS